jgi:hypothetical protein
MESVVAGYPITREAHYVLAGVLTDPVLPVVTIRDPLGVAAVTDVTPDRVSVGVFRYVFTVPADGLLGAWATEWGGSLGGRALTPVDDPFLVLPPGAIVVPIPVSYTYNPTTPVGQLRLLIDDRDMSSISDTLPLERRSAIFTDDEIQAILDVSGQELMRAAAKALLIIAGNRSLLVQKRTIGKSDIDFGQLRSDLIKLSQEYLTQANEMPADGLVEQVWDDFSLRRIITNVQLREDVG